MWGALFIAGLLVVAIGGASALPGPGEHSRQPKYWPRVGRWVTNFTALSLAASPPVGLSPDDRGGLWFAIDQSIEHIDRAGRMRGVLVTQSSGQWLWRVWDIARDARGRRWFSIGQSGRIGTLDARGRVRTTVLVERRFFPDIRTLRFDRDGALWFIDEGRRSIGVRSPRGIVSEKPIPAGAWPVGFTLCRDRAFVATVGPAPMPLGTDAIYALDERSLEFALVASWPGMLTEGTHGLSVACDRRDGVLWFAHSGRATYSIDGTIDRAGTIRQRRSALRAEHVIDTPGGVIVSAIQPSRSESNAGAPVVIRVVGKAGSWERTLPMDGEYFANDATVAPDGTLWLVTWPYSISRLWVQP